MPIWLRNLTFNNIKEFFEKQNEQEKKKSTSSRPTGPGISPSYTTKASK